MTAINVDRDMPEVEAAAAAAAAAAARQAERGISTALALCGAVCFSFLITNIGHLVSKGNTVEVPARKYIYI